MKRARFDRRKRTPRDKIPRHNFVTPAQRERNDEHEEDNVPANIMLKELLKDKVDRMFSKMFDGGNDSRARGGFKPESIISPFNPEDRDVNVRSWLSKIDQLGAVHQWNDYVKSCTMQEKLQGQAREWYNRLDNYDLSWSDWKLVLTKAFLRNHDFAEQLEELIARRKIPEESMTKYYHEKLALCTRCKFDDEATISCIIKGLPIELQSNARAFKCASPEDLYSGFLAALDKYKSPAVAVAQNNQKRDSGSDHQRSVEFMAPPFVNKKSFTTDMRPTTNPSAETTMERNGSCENRLSNTICFRCQQTGHIAKFCVIPDSRRCVRCGSQGHFARNCDNKIVKDV